MKKFLLHTCCGPCSVAIFEKLKSQFELTAYFYNPNIWPAEEYFRRLEAVRDSIKTLKGVKLIEEVYEPAKWSELCLPLKDEPEGGRRCELCFKMRMERAAAYAKENNFDIWGTTITSGRNKRADVINPIGLALAERYGVPFHEADWKKGGGQEKARELCARYHIYRQDYCGCIYSKKH